MAKSKQMKLKSKDLQRLRAAFAGGGMPGYDQEGYDELYELEETLNSLLESERERVGFAGMDPERRNFLAISALNVAVKGDGLLTGVAINDPELLQVAVEAAGALGLADLRGVLAEAVKHLPPFSEQTAELDGRLEWYESEEGAAAAERLEELEERFHEAEPEQEYVGACLAYANAHAAAFFEGA